MTSSENRMSVEARTFCKEKTGGFCLRNAPLVVPVRPLPGAVDETLEHRIRKFGAEGYVSGVKFGVVHVWVTFNIFKKNEIAKGLVEHPFGERCHVLLIYLDKLIKIGNIPNDSNRNRRSSSFAGR